MVGSNSLQNDAMMEKENMNPISVPTLSQFRERILAYYRIKKRDFPWRHTANPYHIFISEMMLQQTQTARVIPYYTKFIARFPDFYTLAQAPFADVMEEWSGLGYNRRARYLHHAASQIVTRHNGTLPSDADALCALPGIGANTAGALQVFAFNLPVIFIETNIRRVFLFFFFPLHTKISDLAILPLIERTLHTADPRSWYSALMDYGAMLSTAIVNPNRRSAGYRPQSRFEGSNRQVRGIILRALLAHRAGLTSIELAEIIQLDHTKFTHALTQLEQEQFIICEGEMLYLSSQKASSVRESRSGEAANRPTRIKK